MWRHGPAGWRCDATPPVAADPNHLEAERAVSCRAGRLRRREPPPICEGWPRQEGSPPEEDEMSAFADRQRAHEAKFVRDLEVQFRITARRNRLLCDCAPGRLRLTTEETEPHSTAVDPADFHAAAICITALSEKGSKLV